VERLARRRLRFLMGRTFAHDRCPQARAQVVGQFVELGVAVNFDGFTSGVADHIAVMAPCQMIVEFGLGPVIQRTIEIVGQFV